MPDIFRVSGFYPNSNWTAIYAADFASANASGNDFINFPERDWYATVGWDNSDHIVALGSHGQAGQIFVNIAAGQKYIELDRIQCQLNFTPTTFDISVSIAEGIIALTPVAGLAPPDPDPQSRMRASLSDASGVQGLSQIVTSLWTSIVGDSFINNVANMQVRNGTRAGAIPTDATVLAAVS